MKLLKKVKGFTLIELMVVIAILGILCAIAIPTFIEYKKKQEAKQLQIQTEHVVTEKKSTVLEKL